MGGGHGDDLMWDGLACPPLEDYAFNFFDTSSSTLEDSLLEDLLDNQDQELDLVSLKSVQGRRGAKVHYYPRHCGNHGKGKDLHTVIQAMELNEEQIKAIFGETDEVVENRDKKKRKIMDFNGTQPMQRKDKTVLDQRLESKRIADYESRFEASTQMLHKAYKQAGEAKQQRHIQVIDFQKPEIQQPGSKGKAKGKPSLRQKLMAMGTCKSNKKFPPYKMLSSCN